MIQSENSKIILIVVKQTIRIKLEKKIKEKEKEKEKEKKTVKKMIELKKKCLY
jgi:hypothetical protein